MVKGEKERQKEINYLLLRDTQEVHTVEEKMGGSGYICILLSSELAQSENNTHTQSDVEIYLILQENSRERIREGMSE